MLLRDLFTNWLAVLTLPHPINGERQERMLWSKVSSARVPHHHRKLMVKL